MTKNNFAITKFEGSCLRTGGDVGSNGSACIRLNSLSYNSSNGILTCSVYGDTTSMGSGGTNNVSLTVTCFYN